MSIGPDLGRGKRDLARLVGLSTESPPAAEHLATELVGRLLREADFDVVLNGCVPGSTDVVARTMRGSGPCLAFSSHTDLIPAGDSWTLPLFQLTGRDGRLYGRGALRPKGSLIAIGEALRMLADPAAFWRGTLLAVLVADEKAASEGALSRRAMDYVVVGGPTENGTVIADKGSLRHLPRGHGVAAGSGIPALGDSIMQAHRDLLLDRCMILGEDAQVELKSPRGCTRLSKASASVQRLLPSSRRPSARGRRVPIILSSPRASKRVAASAPGPRLRMASSAHAVWLIFVVSAPVARGSALAHSPSTARPTNLCRSMNS